LFRQYLETLPMPELDPATRDRLALIARTEDASGGLQDEAMRAFGLTDGERIALERWLEQRRSAPLEAVDAETEDGDA